jgi:hypothetical protein
MKSSIGRRNLPALANPLGTTHGLNITAKVVVNFNANVEIWFM